MDVVKSRLQADGVYLTKYRGVLDCISQSYQKEGLQVSTLRPWVGGGALLAPQCGDILGDSGGRIMRKEMETEAGNNHFSYIVRNIGLR